MEDTLWSDCIPSDILGLISSRLVAAEYFAFRAVCKRWRYAPVTPPPRPRQPEKKTPCLFTLRGDTGIVEFYHPVYNIVTTTSIPIPKLRGSRILSSKANWLLMSHGNRGMFFFNPISNDIIELPDLLEEHGNIFSSWTFSCPPDSSSFACFVVGLENSGCPPEVCIIKVGEIDWTYHNLYDRDRYKYFYLTGCNNPIFFKNNIVYVLGDKGNLGILTINENSIPSWEFYGSYFRRRKQKSIQHVYTVEDVDNEGMIAVFLSHHEGEVEVWRYNMNGEVLEREKITSLDNNKTLFVSLGGSFLKTCVAQGLGNKIYFSMFHDNKGVFYCLANRKYYSFDYFGIKAYSSPNIFNLVRPRSCIWIEPENY
ncbi:F-box protein At4g00893-like [Solanum dulcamara]|uniref:F-box protein At4g00893-like n=1 Tax=Solanum dulcamara TaxID=45834 RepID=UPI00248694A5|nr:F-box protein At4g00893-like [Solanum dulcamara]